MKAGFTDAQREIIERQYLNGLISTSEDFQKRLILVAERTGLEVYMIKSAGDLKIDTFRTLYVTFVTYCIWSRKKLYFIRIR